MTKDIFSTPQEKRRVFLAACLYDAIEDRSLRQLSTLLEKNNADPCIYMPYHDTTPFHYVVVDEDIKFAYEASKLFLLYGANPNVKSVSGKTPVHLASALGRTEILQLLLSNGGDPLCLDDQGWNPFHCAFKRQHYDIIALLGKYCEGKESTDEQEKYEIKLEKVYIDSGNVLAEYTTDISDCLLSAEEKHAILDRSIDAWLKYSNTEQKNSSDNNSQLSCLSINKTNSLEPQNSKQYHNVELLNNLDFQDEKNTKYIIELSTEMQSKLSILTLNKIKNSLKNCIQNENSSLQENNHGITIRIDDFENSEETTNITRNLKDFINFRRHRFNTSSINEFSKINCVGNIDEGVSNCHENLAPKKQNKTSERNEMKDEKYSSLVFNISCESGAEKKSTEGTKSVFSVPLRKISYSSHFCDDSVIVTEDNSVQEIKATDEQLFFINEVYKYRDNEANIHLLERRLCVANSGDTSDTSSYYSCNMDIWYPLTGTKNNFNPPPILLRQRLTDYGEKPGPITVTTYGVYLKRLMKLKQENRNLVQSDKTKIKTINRADLLSIDWIECRDDYEKMEEDMVREFIRPDPSRKWREGTSKTSFNYLLLDPRITQDLPRRAAKISTAEKWKTFLSAIFYVGKGKRSRPYAHLYDAFNIWTSRGKVSATTDKIKRIMDIWNEGQGVVALHVFQNIIPAEAYTREALMIETLGLNKIMNCKSGDYYGVVSMWPNEKKRKLGKFLLYKAMQMLMLEKERQLFPEHI